MLHAEPSGRQTPRVRELAASASVKNTGEGEIRTAAALRFCRAGARLSRLPDHSGDRTPVTQLFVQARARLCHAVLLCARGVALTGCMPPSTTPPSSASAA